MKAVVIGAGRIGCGLAADLLYRSGFEVIIAGRGEAIEALARTRGCRVRLTDGRVSTEQVIEFADAVHLSDTERIHTHIAEADLVCTAVGAGQLDGLVADLVAGGLRRARRPVDVIAFENQENAAAVLRTALVTRMGSGVDAHGVSGSVIARAVAQRVLPTYRDQHLLVVGDYPDEVHVDAGALTGAWTAVQGLIGVTSFPVYYRRTLFRFSAGHATAAYLGAAKGYRFLHAAVADPEIADAVLTAMEEGRRGLAARYGQQVAGTPDELLGILDRFGNAVLGDTVERVGRDVPRKLARNERITGAARLAHRAGVTPNQLAITAAAALHQAPSVTGVRPGEAPTREIVARITGLKPSHPWVATATEAGTRLAAGGIRENLLLSLTDHTWAWDPRPQSTRCVAATGVPA